MSQHHHLLENRFIILCRMMKTLYWPNASRQYFSGFNNKYFYCVLGLLFIIIIFFKQILFCLLCSGKWLLWPHKQKYKLTIKADGGEGEFRRHHFWARSPVISPVSTSPLRDCAASVNRETPGDTAVCSHGPASTLPRVFSLHRRQSSAVSVTVLPGWASVWNSPSTLWGLSPLSPEGGTSWRKRFTSAWLESGAGAGCWLLRWKFHNQSIKGCRYSNFYT